MSELENLGRNIGDVGYWRAIADGDHSAYISEILRWTHAGRLTIGDGPRLLEMRRELHRRPAMNDMLLLAPIG